MSELKMQPFKPATGPTEVVVELDTMREFYRLATGRWTKLELSSAGVWSVACAAEPHSIYGHSFKGTTLEDCLEKAIAALKGH